MAYYYSPFRKTYTKDTSGGCAFCSESLAEQTITENETYRWTVNWYPKFEGHTMLIPKRHVTVPGTETAAEAEDREKMLLFASEILGTVFPGTGIEVFLQSGESSESSVPHLHWHVVPASKDDPLRSFEKLGHFYTIEPGKERAVIFPIPITRSPGQLLETLSEAVITTRKGR